MARASRGHLVGEVCAHFNLGSLCVALRLEPSNAEDQGVQRLSRHCDDVPTETPVQFPVEVRTPSGMDPLE